MKEKERFVGACSKWVDGVGWTTDIPVEQIEAKGYRKIKEKEVVLTFDDLVARDKKTQDFYTKKVGKKTAKEVLTSIKNSAIELAMTGKSDFFNGCISRDYLRGLDAVCDKIIDLCEEEAAGYGVKID